VDAGHERSIGQSIRRGNRCAGFIETSIVDGERTPALSIDPCDFLEIPDLIIQHVSDLRRCAVFEPSLPMVEVTGWLSSKMATPIPRADAWSACAPGPDGRRNRRGCSINRLAPSHAPSSRAIHIGRWQPCVQGETNQCRSCSLLRRDFASARFSARYRKRVRLQNRK
jgi:hypothetical protein